MPIAARKLALLVCLAGAVLAAGAPRLPEGPGRALVEDVCTYCHSLNKLRGQRLSRDEWRDLTKGMIFEGAPVTDEEFSLILDYLAKNFGEKDPQ